MGAEIQPTDCAVDVRIQEADFSLGAVAEETRQRLGARVGAMVSFVGLVREFTPDRAVRSLTLEQYPGMTESSIRQIADEASQRWRLLDCVVIHRVGELRPADQIVLVNVASAHRPDAFAACEFLMDYLKTRAVLWKRERYDDGTEVWVSSTDDDGVRERRWQT